MIVMEPQCAETKIAHDNIKERIASINAAIKASEVETRRQEDIRSDLEKRLHILTLECEKVGHIDDGGMFYGFCTVCGACLG